MRFKPGIKFSLLLLGVLPAALIGLVIAGYFVHARVNDLDVSLRDRGDVIVRQLAAAATSDLASGNSQPLQELTDTALKENDVVEVEVWDATGKVASSRLPFAGENSADQLVLTMPVFRPARESGFAGKAPAAELQRLGNVRLVLSRKATLQSQRATVIEALCIGLGGLTVTALLAIRLGKKISSPVLSLTTAVHALSEGRMETRAQSPADAELAYLQAGFNAMAAELQKNRQILEQQVQNATRQLQHTLKSLEKRNAELDVARRNAEMQTALKSQFLAQMSHEIRTPMNGIIGFAELLGQTALSAEQHEKLRLIERSAKNLLAIINEILDLARLEAGKISLNIHLFMLRPYLEDAVALLTQHSGHLPIILWVIPEVPGTVLGDPIRIQQVINNLLGNALKFTRHGRIVIRVRLKKQGTAPRLLFSVSDSGSGICPADLATLFLPFQQLSEYAPDRERGAGLGLTIASNLVERMGGHLHVASRLGRGTTFWFELPITHATSEEAPPPKLAAVAVVDNDTLSRQALKFQLEALGTTVSCFTGIEDFANRYQAEAHGAIALLNVPTHQGEAATSLARWLDQATSRGARPVLILPQIDKRLREFYRHKGATCLFAPAHSERLRALLTIPLEAPQSASGAGAHRAFAAPPNLVGRNILIADDNEINRILLGAQLTGLGASVESARDGMEALLASRTTPFDLIILDVQMPGMDGLSAVRELRGTKSINQTTPVIAITAHAQPAQQEAIRDAGFVDCLIKPILEEQLRELIQTHLGPPRNGSRRPPPPQPHVETLLDKTHGNRELALTISRKLFKELPCQLREVTDALQKRELATARAVTHKIHGSAAFCGLQEIRQAADKLETALAPDAVTADCDAACQVLAQAIEAFMAMEPATLETLTLMAERDCAPPLDGTSGG